MNTKHLLIALVLFSIVISACAGSAPTSIAQYPAATQPASQEGGAPLYTAPLATQAPLYISPSTESPVGAMPTQAYFPALTATAPPDQFFQDYSINPYISTATDHLSTFALDVDTASYTVARRYLTEGSLPPAEAVRVEEFVNYFKQDYANPPNVAFGLYADGAQSPFTRDGTHILRFGVQGYVVPESERKPAVLTFVIDISGSMAQENRLALVKRSLELLVERLRPSDVVSIVVYGSEARVLLNPTNGAETGTILNAIYSLNTEGATNAEAGLRLGYDIANRAYRPDAINRVILCSDGVANVGVTNPDSLSQSVRGYADAGITLTTMGFGLGDYNDKLMEGLADDGDGNYAYIDDLGEAKRMFIDNLTSTLQVIALNAKVQVDFNSEVVSQYRLIGYENRAVADSDFRNNNVDAGEIGAGHTVTALYAVRFVPGAEGRIATMSMRWEDPTTHEVKEINGDFNSRDMAKTFDDASPRYQLDVVVAQFAEVLRGNPYARETLLNDIRVRADRLSVQLSSDPDVVEFAQLVSRATQLKGW